MCSEDGKVFLLKTGAQTEDWIKESLYTAEGFFVESVRQIGVVKDKTMYLSNSLPRSVEYLDTEESKKMTFIEQYADNKIEELSIGPASRTLSSSSGKWNKGAVTCDPNHPDFAYPKFGHKRD